MNICTARAEDVGALTAIALAAKRHSGYPEQWIEQWEAALTITPEFIAASDAWIVVIDGEAAGFYAQTCSGERAVLEHLWVLPRFMGRGAGRGLFEHALDRCRARGCTVLEIESDPNAQGFYERMGARRVGERNGQVDGRPRVLPVMEMRV